MNTAKLISELEWQIRKYDESEQWDDAIRLCISLVKKHMDTARHCDCENEEDARHGFGIKPVYVSGGAPKEGLFTSKTTTTIEGNASDVLRLLREQELCGEFSPVQKLTCTKPKGHSDNHVATIPDKQPVEEWSQDKPCPCDNCRGQDGCEINPCENFLAWDKHHIKQPPEQGKSCENCGGRIEEHGFAVSVCKRSGEFPKCWQPKPTLTASEFVSYNTSTQRLQTIITDIDKRLTKLESVKPQ